MPFSYSRFFAIAAIAIDVVRLPLGAFLGLSLYIAMAWWNDNWSMYFDLGNGLVLLALFVQAALGILIMEEIVIPFMIVPVARDIYNDVAVPYFRARDAKRRGLQWDKNSPHLPR